ncbi:MAG: cephalosporin hydroxylase family protein [Ferruginibacter sp.]
MNEIEKFQDEKKNNIILQGDNKELKDATNTFMEVSIKSRYSYNFSWMGRPIIQYPQDMIAMQEIIWDIKPDLIIETGIAHGGSLIFYASILELIGKGEIVGVDIDIRKHNKEEIEKHSMFKRIKMLEGSSIDKKIVEQVAALAKGKEKVIVVLDSNHTHDHVLEELKLYSPFVSLNSYIIAFDTIVEVLPDDFYVTERPWRVGNNPMTAVDEFIASNASFEIDEDIDNKILVSVAPRGYLKRIN